MKTFVINRYLNLKLKDKKTFIYVGDKEILIDDDEIVCSMLEKLNIEVYRAELNKDIATQTLSISFNSPQRLLMSELQAILKPQQEQREQVVDTV